MTIRIRQLARETLEAGPARLRVAQLARATLEAGPAGVRVDQLTRQTAIGGPARLRVAQLYRSVLRSQRDAPYPNFPVRLLGPPELHARLEDGSLVGGRSSAGDAEYVRMTAGAVWRMGFGEIALWSRETVQAWRTFASGADAGAMPVIVPLWDRRHQPFGNSAYVGASDFAQVVWRDHNRWEAEEVQAVAAAEAARDATEVTFTFAGSGTPIGGEHFSVYRNRFGWRLYRLIRKLGEAEGAQTWEIRPPLREKLPAGTPLNFDSPRCTMRVDGDISEVLSMLRLGRGTPAFVESFARYP